MPPTPRHWAPKTTAVGAAVLLLASCTTAADPSSGGQATSAAAAAGAANSLRGVCPSTIVVQTSWFPQVEHSAVYQLLGQDYKVNAGKKSVTGPLVAHNGVDTGVKVEIRAGGPAIGFQQTSAQMYSDPSITIGMLNTDELVQQSAEHPMLGVVAPLDLDPQILMWDPATHPQFVSIQDIGQTDTRVLYYEGLPFMDYLTGSGILRESQIDGAYDGGPARFVAAKGKLVVQAYATNEPYAWQHEVKEWGKPLRWAFIHDTGYPNYANALGIRPRDRSGLDGCLQRLVPIIQQAQADYMASPNAATDLIVNLVKQYQAFPYSRALADYAVKTMRAEAIVGNGSDATIGNFDQARIARLIGIIVPIAKTHHKAIRGDARWVDLVTNDYTDPKIGIQSPGKR
jgi:hypothetical protein